MIFVLEVISAAKAQLCRCLVPSRHLAPPVVSTTLPNACLARQDISVTRRASQLLQHSVRQTTAVDLDCRRSLLQTCAQPGASVLAAILYLYRALQDPSRMKSGAHHVSHAPRGSGADPTSQLRRRANREDSALHRLHLLTNTYALWGPSAIKAGYRASHNARTVPRVRHQALLLFALSCCLRYNTSRRTGLRLAKSLIHSHARLRHRLLLRRHRLDRTFGTV